MELPHLQKMYAGLKKQGFDYIAIDVVDAPKEIKPVVKSEKWTFPVAINGTGKADVAGRYHVTACPTNYILDKNGKIVAALVGFDPEQFKAAVKKTGVKL